MGSLDPRSDIHMNGVKKIVCASVKNDIRGVGGIISFSSSKLFLARLCVVGDFCILFVTKKYEVNR